MLQTPETNQSVPQSRGHQPGEERFRVIHSDTIRVKLPVGTKMSPHKHPEDRIYTVISGTFYIGLGETFDEQLLTAFAPGSLVVLPGGQAHFHWAKSGDYVTQVSAIGPLGLEYVDASDDPRNQS